MKLLISTGEVSGDIVASLLAERLIERYDARLFGIGGSRMAAAGVDISCSTNQLGTIGVSEAFRAIPPLLRAALELRRRVLEQRPDAALLIGNDVFHVILGRWLRRAGVPTISYFPPQIWIWGALAPLFSPSFDSVLTSFPDEQKTYERHVDSSFVGHYLADVLEARTERDRLEARSSFGIAEGQRVLALLPGSRVQEIERLAPTLFEAVAKVVASRPDVTVLLPVSDPCFEARLQDQIAACGFADRIQVVRNSHDAMRASDLILGASGTASLEATLLGVPMIVAYRVSLLTVTIVRAAILLRLMKGMTMALPNLILGRNVIPELKQRHVNAGRIASELAALIDDQPRRERIQEELLAARALIARPGTLDLVAESIARSARATAPSTLPLGLPSATATSVEG